MEADEKLKNYRENGNTYFKQGKYNEAIKEYTTGILHLKDKEEIAVLFSNRAKCHFKLEELIFAYSDMRRSIDLKFKDYKKIVTMANICEKMENHKEAIQFYNLAYEASKDPEIQNLIILNKELLDKKVENKKQLSIIKQPSRINGEVLQREMDDVLFKPINCPSDTTVKGNEKFFNTLSTENIEIVDIEGLGKGVIAKKDFKKGDLIAMDEAYIIVTLKEDACAYCLKIISVPHNSEFKEECYCSKECQDKAWNQYFKFLNGRNFNKIREIARTGASASSLQPLLYVKLFAMLQLKEEGSNDLDKLELLKHTSSYRSDNLIEFIFYGHYMTIKNLLNLNENNAFDFQFFYKAMRKCVNISYSVNHDNSKELKNFASGIFPTISFCNHSCDPNCTWTQDAYKLGRHIMLTAERNIAKGEQIFVSYIDRSGDYNQRKTWLRQYGFECNCNRCKKEKMVSKKDK